MLHTQIPICKILVFSEKDFIINITTVTIFYRFVHLFELFPWLPSLGFEVTLNMLVMVFSEVIMIQQTTLRKIHVLKYLIQYLLQYLLQYQQYLLQYLRWYLQYLLNYLLQYLLYLLLYLRWYLQNLLQYLQYSIYCRYSTYYIIFYTIFYSIYYCTVSGML